MVFEDFTADWVGVSGLAEVSEAAVLAFAREFDPQPQHMDRAGAAGSMFGQLVASGWHTAAITMRLQLEAGLDQVEGGLMGAGIERIAWPVPVVPGDTLQATVEVVDTRVSRSRPDRGLVRLRTTTRNQKDEIVMEMTATVVAPRRDLLTNL